MDLGVIGSLECVIADHGDHCFLCKGVHEFRIFLVFLPSYKNMSEVGCIRQLFKVGHVVHALHFHTKAQHEIFYHGIVKFPDMGILEFLETKISSETQSFRIPDAHAVIIADDFLGNTDTDCRASLRFTFDREEAVQAPDEAVRDGKTEAQAVRRSGLPRICLIEALKYHFQFGTAHADSCIGHFEKQIDAVFPFFRCDMDIDAALCRILESVVDQMTEYFFELGHIGPHGGRDPWIHVDYELQIRSLERSDFSYGVMQQRSDHIVFFIYRKRAHVDLGIVQNIADLLPDFLPGFHDGQKISLYILVIDLFGADP